MFEGHNKSFYKDKVRVLILPTGTDGCKKVTDLQLEKEENIAILLEETDFCPITTRVNNVKEALGDQILKMILIKNNSNDLSSLTFEEGIIRGMDTTLIYIEKDAGQFLIDYLNQSDSDKIEKVYFNVTHQN